MQSRAGSQNPRFRPNCIPTNPNSLFNSCRKPYPRSTTLPNPDRPGHYIDRDFVFVPSFATQNGNIRFICYEKITFRRGFDMVWTRFRGGVREDLEGVLAPRIQVVAVTNTVQIRGNPITKTRKYENAKEPISTKPGLFHCFLFVLPQFRGFVKEFGLAKCHSRSSAARSQVVELYPDLAHKLDRIVEAFFGEGSGEPELKSTILFVDL